MAACVGNNFAVYVRDSLQTRRGAPSACAAAPVAAQAPHGPRPLCRQVRTRCSRTAHTYTTVSVSFAMYLFVCCFAGMRWQELRSIRTRPPCSDRSQARSAWPL